MKKVLIPDKLRLGYGEYRIQVVPCLPDPTDAGAIMYNERVIMAVNTNQEDLCETVLHEALHAIASDRCRLTFLDGLAESITGKEVNLLPLKKTIEENYVEQLASGICSMLRDNPAFGRALVQTFCSSTAAAKRRKGKTHGRTKRRKRKSRRSVGRK